MRTILKKHWRILLPTIVMAAIWVFSAMNGARSDAQSVPVANFLGLPNGLIRKAAHFTLFASLGALWYNYIRNSNIRKFTPGFTIALSISLAVIYACIDEMHQLFVPGRSGEIRDILIDSVAAITGVAIFALIHYLTRTKEQKAARRKEVEKIWKTEKQRWRKRKSPRKSVASEKQADS
ncbi:MAG: VanZ family protein [Candidatus Saccharimonadales bacterium]